MNSKFSLFLSLLIASGALGAGYYLSKRKVKSAAPADVPYGKTTSATVEEYCASRQASPRDYTPMAVRGCPPKAPSDIIAGIEVVAEYRNCSGIALIRKK
ncbi:MAG: hypothetical protein HY922_02355 [Elusimicrobia bacterium]|nr:hypothetical protein [Elusimicrobiota bacterium]